MRAAGIHRVCLALALAGCSGGKPKPGPEDMLQPSVPGSLRIAVDDPANFNLPPPPIVKILWVRQILVRLTVPELAPSGATWADLTLKSPFGTLFAEQRVPFSSDPAFTSVTSPDVAGPIAVRRPKQVAGGWALDFAIVVGGTELQLRPQAGLWKIAAWTEPPVEVKHEVIVEFGVMP